MASRINKTMQRVHVLAAFEEEYRAAFNSYLYHLMKEEQAAARGSIAEIDRNSHHTLKDQQWHFMVAFFHLAQTLGLTKRELRAVRQRVLASPWPWTPEHCPAPSHEMREQHGKYPDFEADYWQFPE